MRTNTMSSGYASDWVNHVDQLSVQIVGQHVRAAEKHHNSAAQNDPAIECGFKLNINGD